MDSAFDNLLQIPVTAKNAANNNHNEAFRYECLACGEEVTLAAKDSYYMVTHFRHKSGNNDKSCELYLGKYGAIRSKKRNNRQERIELYYSNFTKCFSISLNFSEEEIIAYEEANTTFEIRKQRNSVPFFEKRINHQSFSAGVPERFILEQYAIPYFVSNTMNNQKREYFFFYNTRPSFFKVLLDDEEGEGFSAKLIKSNVLYTKTTYFVAWPGRNTAEIKLRNLPGVEIKRRLDFKTFNNTRIWGLVLRFEEKSALLEYELKQWEYELEAPETIDLLWPPAYEELEKYVVPKAPIYLYSTFRFRELGNINVFRNNIHEISNGVTKITHDEDIHILEKNEEMTIVHSEYESNYIDDMIDNQYCYKFSVPEGNDYFLFSYYGVEKLKVGQTVFLTPNSYIVEYRDRRIVRKIRFLLSEDEKLEQRIQEALSNYWLTVTYDSNFKSDSNMINNYLNECKISGMINQAVYKMLKDEEK